jgi:WD40 repeat protein
MHNDFVKALRVHVFAHDPFSTAPDAPMRTLLFSGSSDKSIRVWDAETGEHLRKLEGHRRGIECIVVDAEGHFLYSSSSDGTIRKFNIATGECVSVFEGHETSVYGLKLMEDEEELWSCKYISEGAILML